MQNMRATTTLTIFLSIITSVFAKYIWETLPDYDYQMRDAPKQNLRQNFLERKKNKEKENSLNVDSSTEFFEGIPHTKVNGKQHNKEKVDIFEQELRQLFSMNGVKYTYKRDFTWRTWRQVEFSNGSSDFIHYKCNNREIATSNVSATRNQACGIWVIEEDRIRCPFEIWSVISKYQLCCTHITNIVNISAVCPSKVTYSDLSTCDNPIKTNLRIQRDYRVPDRTLNLICQGRENCDIQTFYQLLNQSVIFRIINSTNDIIYSKLMNLNGNFACVDDCGRVVPETGLVIKTDTPFKLNMLQKTSRKKKREFQYRNGKKRNWKTKMCSQQNKKIKRVPIRLEKYYSDEKGIDYVFGERRGEESSDDVKPAIYQC